MSYSHTRNRGGNFRRRRNTRSSFKPKSFDPSRLVKKATGSAPVEKHDIKHAFADFALSAGLQKNIEFKKYTAPTPIQDQIIPHILVGTDVVGLANTGTGKTAAFLIPLVQKVLTNPQEKILIVAPTRELADQIQSELQSLAYGLRVYATVCIGGVSINRQINSLSRNPQFVIGTPGRIKDLSERRNLKLETYKTIVLDEVDQMMDMGFIHDIKKIIRLLPKERHSLFFSATMTEAVQEIMRGFLTDHITVSVKTKDTIDNIDQDVVSVGSASKLDILVDMLRRPEFSKVLVFGSTKWKLNKLEQSLREKGFRVSAIHGNKSQQQRSRVLDQFKRNGLQALLATDVVSRGIDIDSITHVINFDMPQTYEDYIHRIGRTGRADKVGKAITFID